MTIKEAILKRLYDNGMFPDQAAAVMEQVIANSESSMDKRWNDNEADYAPSIQAVLWITVKIEALKYIDANCPEAWFRPTFAE